MSFGLTQYTDRSSFELSCSAVTRSQDLLQRSGFTSLALIEKLVVVLQGPDLLPVFRSDVPHIYIYSHIAMLSYTSMICSSN